MNTTDLVQNEIIATLAQVKFGDIENDDVKK